MKVLDTGVGSRRSVEDPMRLGFLVVYSGVWKSWASEL